MKKIFISLLVIGAIFCTGVNKIMAAEQGYISVNASSEMELTPDSVDFSVEVVTTSKDSMQKAIAENKKVSGKVYEDLKKSLDKAAGDSIKTSNYSANPVYKYVNNKRVLDYYQVRNSVKIHTKKIAEVGKMIDTATADGATSVNNISYSVSKYDEECNKLLAETAKKARRQAENITTALGSQILGVKSVDGSCSLSGRNTMPRMMLNAKAMGAMADSMAQEESYTNIEVGTMTLYARINAFFYIK